MPADPLTLSNAATATLPRTIEAERTVIRRIGRDIFRNRLMIHWRGTRPLTGITDPVLPRTRHVTPWADCAIDAGAARRDGTGCCSRRCGLRRLPLWLLEAGW